MMKIAFFTSAHPVEPIGLNFSEKMMPLGVGFLLSVLKRAGYEVDFFDRYLTGDLSFPVGDYDFVCIYSNTPCFEDTLRIIRHYKGKSKIIVGGPHTSIYPETLIGVGVKYIVQGEGEQILPAILRREIEQGIILYPRIENLDILPRPDYARFSKMPYLTRVKWFSDQPVYNYNSSRGCPFSCTFCDVKRIWGRKYTSFSVGRIIDDIEWLIRDFGVKGIYFREDNFTCQKKRVRSICEEILKRNIKIKWLCETRVNTIDEETISLMARAGCKVFYVGFESGSQRMLDIFNKETTVEQGLNVSRWARESGVQIAGSFIYGHPLETDNDRKLTHQFKTAAKLSTVWDNKFRPNFDAFVERILKNAERDLSD